ncbi:FAD-dependent oxidoreductase [Desulfatiferula olefinivorans]
MVTGLVTPESIINKDSMLENAGINVIVDDVTHVDPKQKQVTLAKGKTLSYDKLFLATGSSVFKPPMTGINLDGAMGLRNLEDAGTIIQYFERHNPKKIVFLGAGFISMEMASILMTHYPDRYDISLVELADHPLPLMLDGDMAAEVTSYVRQKGIHILTGQTVTEILGRDGRVCGVKLSTGETLDADVVFINVGVRPNLELARQIGLEIADFGITVNEYQETSDPDILAGGDCVQKINVITGKPDAGRLRGPAVMQGRLAAKRLAGFNVAYPGVINAGGCRMFDMAISCTGLNEATALREGYDIITATAESRTKHGMIPGMTPWKLKLIFDRKTTRLIGGQIVGYNVAPAREIDAVTALILGQKTITDLTTFTAACNPDISSEPSAEPIAVAAEQAFQKWIKRRQ